MFNLSDYRIKTRYIIEVFFFFGLKKKRKKENVLGYFFCFDQGLLRVLILFSVTSVNRFSAMLAAPFSPWKTTNKNAKFQTVKAFLLPSVEHVKGFLSKCTVLIADLL